MAHHGFLLHSPGLPPTSTGVFYKPLFKTLCLIGWSRETPLLPKSSCGPKVSKRSIFADLLNNIHFRRLSTNLQNLFDWMEQGNATPAKIILWTKGLQKVHLRRPPEQHPFPEAQHQPTELRGPSVSSTSTALYNHPPLVDLPESV